MIRASQEHGPRCDTGDLDDMCPDCLASVYESGTEWQHDDAESRRWEE